MHYQPLSIVLTLFIITLVHTVEPHHWMPFALVGKGQRWSMAKTLTITAVSGLGKSLVSVALGFGMVFLTALAYKGIKVLNLEWLEDYERQIIGSLLILTGLALIIYHHS